MPSQMLQAPGYYACAPSSTQVGLRHPRHGGHCQEPGGPAGQGPHQARGAHQHGAWVDYPPWLKVIMLMDVADTGTTVTAKPSRIDLAMSYVTQLYRNFHSESHSVEQGASSIPLPSAATDASLFKFHPFRLHRMLKPCRRSAMLVCP